MAEAEFELIAGKDFPWNYIERYFMLMHGLNQFAVVQGEDPGRPVMGAYGLVRVELPNPDVDENQRRMLLPVEHGDDYLVLSRMLFDKTYQAGDSELVVLYLRKRNLLGRPRPSVHAALYPSGTWQSFFDAVENYRPNDFTWPPPLLQYEASGPDVFPESNNRVSA